MKNIFYTSGLLIVFFTLLFSCREEAETDNRLGGAAKKYSDYMPLKVGAKYEYRYQECLTEGSTRWLTETICLWEFISVSADSVLYKVKVTANGYRVTLRNFNTPLEKRDTTLIKDSVSIGTWVYNIRSDRKILTHTADWFPRFLQSEAVDTCLNYHEVCLKKNVGITSSAHFNTSNWDGCTYYLIKGPYY